MDAPSEEVVEHMPQAKRNAVERVPMLNNYFFSALAGVTWYLQFFFYTMGETQMGNYKFSSWTLHMASIIIFSSLWGIALKEWKGSGAGTKRKLAIGPGHAGPVHDHRRVRELSRRTTGRAVRNNGGDEHRRAEGRTR